MRLAWPGSGVMWGVLHGVVGVGLVALLAGCPTPRDGDPQIPVRPGLAGRLLLVPGHTVAPLGDGRGAGQAGAARVHPLTPVASDALGGSAAAGQPGDLVLENDEVVFVVAQRGHLVDAADARARQDELGLLATRLGRGREVETTRLTSGVDADGTAWVVALGHDHGEPALQVQTRYALHPGDRALLVVTALANRGDRAVLGLALGDTVQWGRAQRLAPGKPLDFAGSSQGPYLGGVGRFAAYALTSTEGHIEADSGPAGSETTQESVAALGPGQSVQFARVLVVGERPDSASLVAELTRAAGGELGHVTLALVDGAGAAVPADGARVSLAPPGASEVLFAVGTAEGLAFDVPPGRWEVRWAPGAGERSSGERPAAPHSPIEVRVSPGAAVTGALTVGGRSTGQAGTDGR